MNLKTDTTLTSVDDSPRTHDVAIRSRPPSIAAVNSPTGTSIFYYFYSTFAEHKNQRIVEDNNFFPIYLKI